MSDPLSIAGSAVGVISLGIQVSQSLYHYISSVRGRDKELDSAARQIEHLVRTLEALHHLVPKIQALPESHAKAIKALQQCAKDSEHGIKELQEVLDSLQDVPNTDLKGKMKNAGRLLTYGLRREDLNQVRDKVLALTATTELALQVINSDLGVSHSKDMASLKTMVDTRFSATDQRLQHLEQNTVNCAHQLEMGRTTVETTSTKILTSVDSLRDRSQEGTNLIMSQMQVNLEAIQTLLVNQHQQTQAELASIHSSQKLVYENGLRLLQKPAALREICDRVNYDSEEVSGDIQPSQGGITWSSCDCSFRIPITGIRTTKQVFGKHVIIYGQSQELSRHSRKCLLYAQRRRQAYGTQIRLNFGRIVSTLINVSLSYTTGAGGYSLASQLRCKHIVKSSPAFDLAITFMNSMEEPDAPTEVSYWGNQLCWFERDLIRLFQDGKASPDDLHGGKWSLATHASIYLIIGIQRVPIVNFNLVVCHFIRVLIKLGVLEDEYNGTRLLLSFCHPMLPVQINHARLSAVSVMLAEIAGSSRLVLSKDTFVCNFAALLLLIAYSPELFLGLDLPPIIQAIVLRSEVSLRSMLENFPEAVFETYNGFTVLHFSANWPKGLSLLLSTDARGLINKRVHGEEYSVLYLAFTTYCDESCRLLLSHGALWSGRPDGILDLVSLETVGWLAKHLADRRKKLWHLAMQTLSPRQLEQIGVPDGTIPDRRAAFIVKLLQEARVSIPITLMVPEDYEGVYFDGHLTMEQVRIFFEAGFHEINDKSKLGFWSLHYMSPCWDQDLQKQVIDWLKTHSWLDQVPTDPSALGLNTTATGWHYMSLLSTNKFVYVRSRRSAIFTDRHPVHDILETQARDVCQCWCSPQGCTPMKVLLKVASRDLNLNRAPDQGALELISMKTLEKVSTEIMTFLTFEALEMTHTCCFAKDDIYDQGKRTISITALKNFPGNVFDIHDEERMLGRRLGKLVEEFRSEFASSNQSLLEFLHGYWRARMAEECIPSSKEKRKLGQTGDIIVDKYYETPFSIQILLGEDFSFLDLSETEPDSDSESGDYSEEEGTGEDYGNKRD